MGDLQQSAEQLSLLFRIGHRTVTMISINLRFQALSATPRILSPRRLRRRRPNRDEVAQEFKWDPSFILDPLRGGPYLADQTRGHLTLPEWW